jgi:hypothetical protein
MPLRLVIKLDMTSGPPAGGMLSRFAEPTAPPWTDLRREPLPLPACVVELKRVRVGIDGASAGNGGVAMTLSTR